MSKDLLITQCLPHSNRKLSVSYLRAVDLHVISSCLRADLIGRLGLEREVNPPAMTDSIST